MLQEGSAVNPAVEARDLVKTYRNGIRALSRLSFSVPPGTVFGLLGPNGAGKSTAVKILTTLSRPDSGEGMVAGYEVGRQSDQIRRCIGTVAQKQVSDPYATGRENLLLYGRIRGLKRARLKQRVSAILDRFELTDAADRMVHQYSGGMRRRLDIAMSLVHEPQVLFLDEPTVGLDPEIRAFVWGEICRLRNEEGVTILLTSHYLEEVDQLADHLAIMEKGRIIAEGTSADLKRRLQGDVVIVDMPQPVSGQHADELLQRIPDVSEVKVTGRQLHARAGNGALVTPAIIGVLAEQGYEVESITVSRPSLDDVYLHITGRSLLPRHAASDAGVLR
jgi:ABC-2 type transport system ATP-binding protein